MRIGQIVSIEDNNIPHVQTGIIIRRERDPDQAQYFWYEVLANDKKTYVLPSFLLSPHPVSYTHLTLPTILLV